MQQRVLVVIALGSVVALSGCHKKAPAVAPVPVNSTQSQPAPPPSTGFTAPNPPPAPSSNPNLDQLAATRTASMADRIHFEYNLADISSDDKARLDAKVALMKQFPTLRIRITGHCDERGSDQYNLALGTRRASAAKDYMVLGGIDAARIDVASLGREVPIDPASTDEAWAKNRRDEFDIIAGTQSLRAP
jgi:peptidoglycan-associated lipoprotein